MSAFCYHKVDLETTYCSKCDIGGEPRHRKLKFIQIFACNNQLYGLAESGVVYRYIHDNIDGELMDGWAPLNHQEINEHDPNSTNRWR